MAHEIVVGDILEWAKTYDGPKFHALFCDPPYHLTSIVKRFGGKDAAPAQQGSDGRFSRLSRGFMGQEWDGGDIAFRPETWAALGQHLLPGAHLLVFGGDRTHHRLMVALEDAGLEIRTCIYWLFGSGFPKSHDVSKGLDKAAGVKRGRNLDTRNGPNTNPVTRGTESYSAGWEPSGELDAGPATPDAAKWDGYGTALKPAAEIIILARKPLDGTVAQNCVKHGCGALNIDGTRISVDDRDEIHAKNPHTQGGFGHAGAEVYGDSHGASTFDPGKGRWPANVLHDGSAEVVGLFPQTGQSKPFVSSSTTGRRDVYADSCADHTGRGYDDSGSAARFFYTAKADTDERERGLLGAVPCMRYGQPGVIHDPDGEGGLITKRHFTVDDKGRPVYSDCRRNPHPTIKPLDLLRYLSLLILPPPGDEPRRILVPFAGVGSEMIGARQAGWDDVLGIEIVKSYADIAVIRLAAWMGML